MPPPLLTAVDCQGHVHLVIGSNPLANARCTRSIEVGATPKLIAPADADVYYLLAQRIEAGEVEWIKRHFRDEDVTTLGREEVDNVVDAVFVTRSESEGISSISQLCRRKRIPVNVVDAPNLCTFTLLSTHSDGPLQIGITTSGNGCKLASRIRREIANTLPKDFGAAVERLGTVRRQLLGEDHLPINAAQDAEEDAYPTSQPPPFNHLISSESDDATARTRRTRWLSQICEYYPLKHLAALTPASLSTLLSSTTPPSPLPAFIPANSMSPRIILAGSGPGSPSLLTLATHHYLLTADLILADKLVPSPILALIPRRTTLHIARKFPGNADAAQEEFLSLGLAALKQGKTVLRLKQGDPFVYGRGGEEVAFFREHGYDPIVVPGITSALSAPLFASIPPTHRGVADQILICTGTGRKGALLDPPEYVEGRTCVFLMALHRLRNVVEGLMGGSTLSSADGTSFVNGGTTLLPGTAPSLLPPAQQDHQHRDEGAKPPVESQSQDQSHYPNNQQTKNNSNTKSKWPPTTPAVIIERASLPDQRVLRSTLQHICAAVEEAGSRPPGLLVVGACCDVLSKKDQVLDRKGDVRWIIEEGGPTGFEVGSGVDVGDGLGGGVVGGGMEGGEVRGKGEGGVDGAGGEGGDNGDRREGGA